MDLTKGSFEVMEAMANMLQHTTGHAVFFEFTANAHSCGDRESYFRLSFVTSTQHCHAKNYKSWQDVLDVYHKIMTTGKVDALYDE